MGIGAYVKLVFSLPCLLGRGMELFKISYRISVLPIIGLGMDTFLCNSRSRKENCISFCGFFHKGTVSGQVILAFKFLRFEACSEI